MAEPIATAVVEVKAETKNLGKGFRNAQRNVSSSGKKMETNLKRNMKNIGSSSATATSSIKTMGMALKALVAGVIVRGLINMGRSLMAFGSRITDMATQTGLTTDEFQALDFVFLKAGVSSDKLVGIMAKLNMAIGEAKQGVITYTDAFENAGISIDKLHKLNTRDLFVEIAKELKNATRGTIKYAAIMELLGAKNVPKAEEAILRLAEGFKKLIKEAREAGVVMEEFQAIRLDKAEDSLQKTKNKWQIWKADVKDVFTDLFGMTDSNEEFKKSLKERFKKAEEAAAAQKTKTEVTIATKEVDVTKKAAGIFGPGQTEKEKLKEMRQEVKKLVSEAEKLRFREPLGRLNNLNKALDIIVKIKKAQEDETKEIQKQESVREELISKREKLLKDREKIGLTEDKATTSSLVGGRGFINVAQRIQEEGKNKEAETALKNIESLDKNTAATEELSSAIEKLGPVKEIPPSITPEEFGLPSVAVGV